MTDTEEIRLARFGPPVPRPLIPGTTPGVLGELVCTQAAEIELLKDTLAGLRSAMTKQTERERRAGEHCHVPYVVHGCEWPDAVAERILFLEAEVAALKAGRR